MAEDCSVKDFYECPFCDRLTEHVPISDAEFSTVLVPKTDGVLKPWRCCECGAVCQRRINGDQPGSNAYYLKYL